VLLGFPIALVLAWAYEVKPEEPSPTVPSEEESSPETTAKERRKSIIVLPFDNMSPDPGDAYFSEGLTEEIITNLSYLRSLRVISRTSAMVLKGTQKDTRTIAEELDVQYVLEGSVRKAGNDLRITAQLIDAAADEHLWAESYDRELEDVFRVQTDVAENIALALRTEFSATERERVRRVPTENLKAYELYLRGRSAYQGMLPQDLAEAVELAREAIRLDPDFAQVHAMLAEVYALYGFYANERPSDLFPKLAAAANRSLELDAQVGGAHTAVAVAKLFYEWDWAGAEEMLARSLELNPHDFFALQWKATFLLCRGLFAEAEAVSRQGLASGPLDPLAHHNLGQVLAISGNSPEAIEVLESAVRHWPHLPLLHVWLGLSHFYGGSPEDGLPSLEVAVSLAGAVPFFEAMRGVVLAAVERVGEAREILEDLKARSRGEYVDPFNLFALTVTLDGPDEALPYLEMALEVRSFFLPYACVVPRFRPLHPHPRFRAVMEKVQPGWSPEG
jgi:TolB-like protein